MNAASPFADVKDAIDEIRAGRMVVVVDDEDRENEGDLTMAAEKITPEAVNFMAKFGRGLICLAMTPERLDYLQLQPMTAQNTARFGTAFTESIDALVRGVTTGISAYDRAETILCAIDPATHPWLYAALLLCTAVVAASFVHVVFERPVTRILQRTVKSIIRGRQQSRRTVCRDLYEGANVEARGEAE